MSWRLHLEYSAFKVCRHIFIIYIRFDTNKMVSCFTIIGKIIHCLSKWQLYKFMYQHISKKKALGNKVITVKWISWSDSSTVITLKSLRWSDYIEVIQVNWLCWSDYDNVINVNLLWKSVVNIDFIIGLLNNLILTTRTQ